MRLLTHLQNKGRSNRAGLIPKLEVLDDTLSFLLKLASLRSKLEKESFRLLQQWGSRYHVGWIWRNFLRLSADSYQFYENLKKVRLCRLLKYKYLRDLMPTEIWIWASDPDQGAGIVQVGDRDRGTAFTSNFDPAQLSSSTIDCRQQLSTVLTRINHDNGS